MKVENSHRVMMSGNGTREEERGALERSAALAQKRNENFRRFGTPAAPDGNASIAGALSDVPRGTPVTAETPPYEVSLSPRARMASGKATNPAADSGAGVGCTPVTELRTAHYAGTERADIVETVTAAEELAAHRERFRQEMMNGISRDIGNILKPYATYEEAFEELYNREAGASWHAFDETSGAVTTRVNVTTVQGAFGTFAHHLNNYLDQFGAEDGYFDSLLGALNGLDPGGDDELVNQMRRMVRTVRDGQTIDTGSDSFREEVRDAVAHAYGGATEEKKEHRPKAYEDKDIPEAAGLSWLDWERRKAEEEKDLLDKFTGEEQDGRPESAGEALARRRPGKTADDARQRRQKLEKDGKPEEAPDPFLAAHATEKSGTRLRAEDQAQRQAAYEGWDKISERHGWGAVMESVPIVTPEDEAFLRQLAARGSNRL